MRARWLWEKERFEFRLEILHYFEAPGSTGGPSKATETARYRERALEAQEIWVNLYYLGEIPDTLMLSVLRNLVLIRLHKYM